MGWRVYDGEEASQTMGVGQAHMKKLHSILRYVESSRGFREIEQVSAHTIQSCRGSVGINA